MVEETYIGGVTQILLIGAGATAMADLWGMIRKRLLDVAFPDYGMVGRWFAHMRHGQFRHDSIAKSPPVRGERFIGWTVHYLIGMAYAALLISIWGRGWISNPSIGPAMIVGLGTVAAPFFLMQPGMGAGIAASRTPNPASARLQSLLMHAAFGFGLYASGQAIKLLA